MWIGEPPYLAPVEIRANQQPRAVKYDAGDAGWDAAPNVCVLQHPPAVDVEHVLKEVVRNKVQVAGGWMHRKGADVWERDS